MEISTAIGAWICGAAALVACAGASDPSEPDPEQIASYRQSVEEIQSASNQYQSDMMAERVTSLAACQQLHARYDADVRPSLLEIDEMSASMDRFMGHHGGGAVADTACIAASMWNELDHHRALACQLPDLPADQAEVVRHVGLMNSYANHLYERSAQLMAVSAGTAGGWGPMMAGCAGWHRGRMMMFADQ